MTRIFISYSRKDEPFARSLAGELARTGIDVWMDIEDIEVGHKWSSAIQQGLDSSDLMLVILSPTSMESSNVEDEFTYFLDQKKPVIPLLHQPTKIHFQPGRVQYIDFHQQPFEVAIKQLFAEINRRTGGGPASMAHTTSAPAQTPLPIKQPTERVARVDSASAGRAGLASDPGVAIPHATVESRSQAQSSSAANAKMMRFALLGGIALVIVVIGFLLLQGMNKDPQISDQRVIQADYVYTSNRALGIKLPASWELWRLDTGGLMIANDSFFNGRLDSGLQAHVDSQKIGMRIGVVPNSRDLSEAELRTVGAGVVNQLLQPYRRQVSEGSLQETSYQGYNAVYAKGSLDDSDYYITVIDMPDKDKVATVVVNTAKNEFDDNETLVQDLIRSIQVGG